jgi:hypothetical protein
MERQRRLGPAIWIAGWTVAWLSSALGYAALIYAQSYGAMPMSMSARVALFTTFAPAAMCPAIWWLAGWFGLRRRSVTALAAVHVILAVLFAGAWAAWMLTVAQLGGGARMPRATLMHAVVPWHLMAGLLVYGLVAATSYALRSAAHARRMELVAEQAERLRAEAHLAALRAHIDPHFLFNTLHSVSELLTSDSRAARQAIERLADVFRYTLLLDRQQLDLVTLEQEWRVVESYLWLEGLRLGERLRVAAKLDDDALLCAIPPFTLQPIVENAVRHGLSPRPSGGSISIAACERDGAIVVKVADDGVGCTPSLAEHSVGFGLRSVRERLVARFGDAARVTVVSPESGGTTVNIQFPATTFPHLVKGNA